MTDDLKEIIEPVPHRIRHRGDGLSLTAYLLETFRSVPPDEIHLAIEEGRFHLRGGGLLEANSILQAGQVLLAHLPPQKGQDPFLPSPEGPVDLLHLDDHLVAIDKPPGLLSYPLGPRRKSALTTVTRQLDLGPEDPALRPLHRIDRETSGVLVMARSIEADRAIKKAFRERAVRKSYLALVRGHVPARLSRVDAPIGPAQDSPIRIQMGVREDGKEAVTEILGLGHFGDRDWGAGGTGYSWVMARPLTGRTHQIRLHLAHLGHPLVGDKIYAEGGFAFLKRWEGELQQEDIDRLELPRHALHAWTLELTHPVTGEELSLLAPVPSDLAGFAQRRGGSSPGSPPDRP